jgi:hypothetical protein
MHAAAPDCATGAHDLPWRMLQSCPDCHSGDIRQLQSLHPPPFRCYYRCATCYHTWMVTLDQPDEPIHITAPKNLAMLEVLFRKRRQLAP